VPNVTSSLKLLHDDLLLASACNTFAQSPVVVHIHNTKGGIRFVVMLYYAVILRYSNFILM